MPYDKLILACGNKVILPKISKIKPINIFALKKLKDAINIRDYIEKTSAKKITIIGGNYFGIITANNFLKKGFDVTIIEENSNIIKQLDNEFSFAIRDELIKHGVHIYTNSPINKFIKNDENKISKIELTDKTIIQTHMIISFKKIQPNMDLALQSSFNLSKKGRFNVNNMM